jgi:hypothetical protein
MSLLVMRVGYVKRMKVLAMMEPALYGALGMHYHLSPRAIDVLSCIQSIIDVIIGGKEGQLLPGSS